MFTSPQRKRGLRWGSVGAGSPDPATVRDRRSPLLHSFGDLRSKPVARSGDRATTLRWGGVSGPRHGPRPKVSAPTQLWRPSVKAGGPVRRPGHNTPLGRGLRTPPRSATEGLRSYTALETFGQSRWPGPETGPQHSVGAGSPDPATVRDRRSPLLHSFGDLRSKPVARSGDRATTLRWGGVSGPRHGPRPKVSAPTQLWRPSVKAGGPVRRPGHNTPLGRGLRTPPRSATEGLRSYTALETFGQSRWPGPETGPQHSVGAGSPDPATVRDRRSPLLHSFGDLRSKPVARSGDRATTLRWGGVSGPRHGPRPKVSAPTQLWRPSVKAGGPVRRPGHNTPLGRGLRTPPRSATEGLRSYTALETFGQSRWPGPETGPQHWRAPLGRGLRTPPRSATEGLRSYTALETFGQSRWPGPETGPQHGRCGLARKSTSP